MARIHTHYDNLKVARNAPSEVIRAAYKTLSQKHHPDHNLGNPDAIRIIQLINSAYEVLSDPVKRKEHDDWIIRMEEDQYMRGAAVPAADGRSQHRTSGNRKKTSHHRNPHHGSAAGSSKVIQKIRLSLSHFFRHFYKKV